MPFISITRFNQLFSYLGLVSYLEQRSKSSIWPDWSNSRYTRFPLNPTKPKALLDVASFHTSPQFVQLYPPSPYSFSQLMSICHMRLRTFLSILCRQKKILSIQYFIAIPSCVRCMYPSLSIFWATVHCLTMKFDHLLQLREEFHDFVNEW